MGALDSVSVGRIVKSAKKLKKRQTCFSMVKNALFDLDLYAYTPSLMTAQFSTWVSLVVSFVVSSLFGFCVAYTLYLWAATDYSVSQGDVAHDNSSFLIPPSVAHTAGLVLPQAGVMLLLGNGSSPVDSSVVKFTWEQSIICNGQAGQKKTDKLPSAQCEFRSAEDDALRTNTTICASWDDAMPTLADLNNTATDLCGVTTDEDGGPYFVPRIAGTFYDKEYAYITATTSINASLLSTKAFATTLYKGSVQLYLKFPYTGTSSLTQGHWPDGQKVVWSRRVNLLANYTQKWEVSLRVRQVSAQSYFWDIPQLTGNALDYTVEFSEISLASTSTGSDGYLEVAKVYIKLDDRDMQVSMTPYGTVFSLFSDWGGFLSILVALGIPAMIYNQGVFRSTVESLMLRGDITFDEELRKKRSEAIATSFAVGVKTRDLGLRKQSVMRIATAIDTNHLQAMHREDSLMADFHAPGSMQLSGRGSTERQGALPDGTLVTMPSCSLAPTLSLAGLGSRNLRNKVAPLPQLAERESRLSLDTTQLPSAVLPAKLAAGGSGREGGALDGDMQAADAAAAGGLIPAVHATAGARRSHGSQGSIGSTGSGGMGRGDGPQAWATLLPGSPPEELTTQPDPTQEPVLVHQSSGPRGGPQPVAESIAAQTIQEEAVDGEPGTATDAAAASQQLQPPLPPAAAAAAGSGLSTSQGSAAALPSMFTDGPQGAGGSFVPALGAPSLAGSMSEPGVRHAASGRAARPPRPPLATPQSARQHSVQFGAVLSEAPASQYGSISMVSRGASEADMSLASHFEAPQATGTASILVKYHQDIFEDSDEDENDFDDVVRHCTSECHALYHLRQVVKLVQHERSFLTCGSEKMSFSKPLVKQSSVRCAAGASSNVGAPQQDGPRESV